MPFEIFQTTAENVISVTDAAYQKPEGVDSALASEFLGTTATNAFQALKMAQELGLLREVSTGVFALDTACGIYLCTAQRQEKAAVLRFVLEQYEPYRTFKARLDLTGVVGQAATQTKALHSIPAHRDTIGGTFVDLGTYSQSLISEGAGLYSPRGNDVKRYLQILDDVIQSRESATIAVRKMLGNPAADWISGGDVLNNLVTSFQRAGEAETDPRAPIVHAANAIESFLAQVGNHYTVNVSNKHGINAKTDELARQGKLTTKHKFILKYLGHIRNAADHGTDSEIGAQWEISPKTTVEYIHVAQSVITAIHKNISNSSFIV